NTTSLVLIDEDEETEEAGDEEEEEEEDIIPFNSSEYEKIPLTPSNSSIDSLNFSTHNRKRPRSPLIQHITNNIQSKPFYIKRKMATSKRRMSLNLLPINSPSTFYYSLTNINDIDDQTITKKHKKTSSKLDIGYESEDENNHLDKNLHSVYHIRKSQSDYLIRQPIPNNNIFLSLTHSLPLFEHNNHFPTWWRHSITSAYDTCSNPDIDFSIEETKKQQTKPSLLMYSKKYTKFKRIKSFSQQQTLSSLSSNIKQKKLPLNPTSNSYDASAEYTDPEQSENDVDILSSDFNSTSPVHHYQNSESQFYNRYTTTTTGYSSDIELETTTTPSETEDQQIQLYDENGFNSLHTIINEKFESSEPCWDGYQNPLFYHFNSQDMDSIETTLKWEDQFLEMDQPNNSSSDDEIHLNENFKYILRNNGGSSSSLTGGVTGVIGNKQVLDSDSDLDDFNYVLNETERQLYKARQSLDKKKRQQPFALNDRNLRKYDEVLRTCETNIQCLQQILKNLHRSKNSRLNSTKAIEQLQTYLSDWHDMRQQVNDDRIRARQLLYISQEIIKLKIRLDEELSHIDSIYNRQHLWLDENSLIELMRRINYEIESEQDSRQKLASYRTDILLAEEHLNEYQISHLNSPSSSSVVEHLHSCRLVLEQLTDKMDTYQTQLRTLLTITDSILPIETQIEQKLTACEYNNNYQIELQNIQKLIDKYEDIICNINYSKLSTNNLHLKLKTHCEHKLDLYKKMLNEFNRKTQSKHVSFDGSINLNNNNSSISQFYTNDINQNTQRNRSQRTETYTTTATSNDINQSFLHDNTSTKQSSTSSYISDDCKVLYIETVIEVAKPVFYERTNDTSTTTSTNKEYHYHKQIPQSINNIQQSSKIIKQIHESSDDDDDDVELNKPVNLIKTKIQQQVDSGIEYDHISLPPSTSSSTIFNQQTIDNNKKLLSPSIKTNSNLNDSTLIQRSHKIKSINKDNRKLNTLRNSYWNRLKQLWLRSLLLGLFLLFILFLIYFIRLDTCSRSTIIRTVSQKIISIEHQGLPTI
ncbi:unnamed protein product, partial [Rotaria sp. Silwood2]